MTIGDEIYSSSSTHVSVVIEDVPIQSRGHRWRTLFNILCTMAGTGILQLPYTFRQGGWITAVVLFIVCVMTNYTGKSLIQCLYTKNHDPEVTSAHRRKEKEGSINTSFLTRSGQKKKSVAGTPFVSVEGGRIYGYPSLGRYAFGQIGYIVVHVVQKMTLLGVSTLFLILAANFLVEAVPEAGISFEVWLWICVAIAATPVLVLKTLKEVAILSVIGMTATIFIVFAVVIEGLLHPPESVVHGDDGHHEHVKHTLINFASFPSAFSAITLSFGGHSVFPTIEQSLGTSWSERRHFKTVFNWAYVALMCMYVPVAVVGYYVYGEDVQSPVLLSLPQNGVLPRFTMLVVTAHVLTAYPILMNVVVVELEHRLLGLDSRPTTEGSEKHAKSSAASGDDVQDEREGCGESSPLLGGPQMSAQADVNTHTSEHRPVFPVWAQWLFRLSLRSVFVYITALIAYYAPYFDTMMTLVGALCISLLAFVFPVLFTWRLRWRSIGILEKLWTLLVIVVGLLGGGIGAVQAVRDLIHQIENNSSV